MSNPYDFGTMASIPPDTAPPSVLSQSAPGVLSQQDPVLSLGRDQAMVDAKRAADRAEQSIDQREEFMRRRAQALSPLRDAQMRSAVQPPPQPPQQQAPPKPPSAEDAKSQTWQQEWLTAAMFLGVLAGGMTRRPLTNSLAAFTGMIEGVNEGQKQKFEQSMKTWEAENKRVLETNEQANKAYDRILKARDLDNEQKLLMLQIEAARWDDDPMAQAAMTKDRIAVAQLHDQRLRYGQELRGAQNRRDEERQERAKQQAAAYAQSREGRTYAESIYDGRVAMPSINQRSPEVYYRNLAIMDMVNQIGDERGQPFDATKFKERGSAATARGRVTETAVVNTEIAMAKAVPVINMAAQAANAVPATEFRALNMIYQMAAEQISDPAIRNFKLINEELAQVWAAALNPRNTQVTVSAQTHARELIASAIYDGPDAYMAMLENVKRLVEQEQKAMQSVRAGQPQEINIPPIAPQRRGTVPGMTESTAGRASAGAQSAFPGHAVNRYGQTREQTSLWQEFTRWLKDNGGSITPMPPEPGQ